MKEKTIQERIQIAIKDLSDAMQENIEAGKAEVDAKIRKEKARYTLQKARERLDAVYKEAME